MRTDPRAPRSLLRAALAAAALLTAALVTTAAPFAVSVAHADEDPPVRVGTQLVARADCELQKVTIARGAKLQVTASGAKTVDVALPDGYVLRRVPVSRIRYFFDVVR